MRRLACVVFVGSIFLTWTSATGQVAQRFKLTACDRGQCADWVFYGGKGNARWPDGSVSELQLASAFFPGITIRRQDVSGHSRGLIAMYSGSVNGNHIEGTVTYTWTRPQFALSWPGTTPKSRPNSGSWTGTLENASDFSRALGWPQTSCQTPTGQAEITPDQAMEIGKVAARFRQDFGAVDCFAKAANQGNAAAKNNLAYAYETGTGVARDTTKAFNLYKEAGDQLQSSWALVNLSRFYDGSVYGIPKDASLATKALQNAATLREQRTGFCRAPGILNAIFKLEILTMKDPNVTMMTWIARLGMGVENTMQEPSLLDAKAMDNRQQTGRFVLDMAGRTGAFVCEALFIRGPGKIQADPNAEFSAQMAAAVVNEAIQNHPHYTESFSVGPLQNGDYQITLIPTGLELARSYTLTVPRASVTATQRPAPPVSNSSETAIANKTCAGEAQLKSPASDLVAQIRFINGSAVPLTIFWINLEGQRIRYKSLKPGENYLQETFAGHWWVAAGPGDSCRKLIVAQPGLAEAAIR